MQQFGTLPIHNVDTLNKFGPIAKFSNRAKQTDLSDTCKNLKMLNVYIYNFLSAAGLFERLKVMLSSSSQYRKQKLITFHCITWQGNWHDNQTMESSLTESSTHAFSLNSR